MSVCAQTQPADNLLTVALLQGLLAALSLAGVFSHATDHLRGLSPISDPWAGTIATHHSNGPPN